MLVQNKLWAIEAGQVLVSLVSWSISQVLLQKQSPKFGGLKLRFKTSYFKPRSFKLKTKVDVFLILT